MFNFVLGICRHTLTIIQTYTLVNTPAGLYVNMLFFFSKEGERLPKYEESSVLTYTGGTHNTKKGSVFD